MQLEMKRFQWEFYADYAAWFSDAELNRQLGPMDEDWLESVLNEPVSEGGTWAVFQSSELVAVIETSFDSQGQLPAGIRAIAVKPALRQQGIGSAALRQLILLHQANDQSSLVTYISATNHAALRFVLKNGFQATTETPDEHGFIEFYYESYLPEKGMR